MCGPYYIVQAISSWDYNVHKFTGNYVPDDTYRVKLRNDKVECSCPSGTYRGYCKHLEMVKKYRELEKLDNTIPIMVFEG